MHDDLLKRPVLEVSPRNLDAREARGRQNEFRIASRGAATGAYVIEALLRFPDLPGLDERGRPARARTRAILSIGQLTRMQTCRGRSGAVKSPNGH